MYSIPVIIDRSSVDGGQFESIVKCGCSGSLRQLYVSLIWHVYRSHFLLTECDFPALWHSLSAMSEASAMFMWRDVDAAIAPLGNMGDSMCVDDATTERIETTLRSILARTIDTYMESSVANSIAYRRATLLLDVPLPFVVHFLDRNGEPIGAQSHSIAVRPSAVAWSPIEADVLHLLHTKAVADTAAAIRSVMADSREPIIIVVAGDDRTLAMLSIAYASLLFTDPDWSYLANVRFLYVPLLADRAGASDHAHDDFTYVARAVLRTIALTEPRCAMSSACDGRFARYLARRDPYYQCMIVEAMSGLQLVSPSIGAPDGETDPNVGPCVAAHRVLQTYAHFASHSLSVCIYVAAVTFANGYELSIPFTQRIEICEAAHVAWTAPGRSFESHPRTGSAEETGAATQPAAAAATATSGAVSGAGASAGQPISPVKSRFFVPLSEAAADALPPDGRAVAGFGGGGVGGGGGASGGSGYGGADAAGPSSAKSGAAVYSPPELVIRFRPDVTNGIAQPSSSGGVFIGARSTAGQMSESPAGAAASAAPHAAAAPAAERTEDHRWVPYTLSAVPRPFWSVSLEAIPSADAHTVGGVPDASCAVLALTSVEADMSMGTLRKRTRGRPGKTVYRARASCVDINSATTFAAFIDGHLVGNMIRCRVAPLRIARPGRLHGGAGSSPFAPLDDHVRLPFATFLPPAWP